MFPNESFSTRTPDFDMMADETANERLATMLVVVGN